MKGLSVLIPTYNDVCTTLVLALVEQLQRSIVHEHYEVLVADDGSRNQDVILKNREINAYASCRYIERNQNVGRAAIRNFLAQTAQYDYLLFIDADMTIITPHFIKQYLDAIQTEDKVIYGGYTVTREVKGNLRNRYELASLPQHTYLQRQKNPYNDFHTSNFLIPRTLMLAHPFDERFVCYGYEDVFFGKTLLKHDIQIQHINNPLAFDTFEDNPAFVSKTQEGINTLYQFRADLEGYSGLLHIANRLSRYHLLPLLAKIYTWTGAPLKRYLEQGGCNLHIFKVYKLLYLSSLYQYRQVL